MNPTSVAQPTDRSAVRTLHLDPADRPFIVIWEVTRACALACAHCRADAITRRNPLELSTDEGQALLDDLAALGAPRPIVVLTGGDPFERGDLVELVRHGHGLGLPMALSPSVTPRLTTEALAELRAAGATAVSLSLDGATPATHDAFRGFDGVHADTMKAAANVRAAGFRLQINTTVTRDNAHELPALLDTVVALGAGLWSVFFLVPTGRGEHLVALDAEGVEDVLMWLASVAARVPVKTTEAPHFRRVMLQRREAGGDPAGYRPGPLGRYLREATAGSDAAAGHAPAEPGGTGPRRPPLDVNAGRGFAFVDHLGTVYPSGFLPLSAGSIREAPFTQIYRRSELLTSLRDPDQLKGRCGRCEYREVCGGSRSHAYGVTGDPLAEDPTCAYQPAGGGG
ncbi:MAG: TIGR04053 family radical SAM/SPASM domain-containing protein [Microthrixaceae bacterium]